MQINLNQTDISVIVPVYNEAENIETLLKRITSVISTLTDSFEIIIVDDGSKDATFLKIQELSIIYPNCKALSFSRNFGHQVALSAGLEHAYGKIVITMDGDLQHPPELIPQMIKKQSEGFDIVNTIRKETADAGPIKNLTAHLFYKLINALSDVHVVKGAADFRLMSRKAVNAFLQIRERDRFTRGLVSWMGFNQAFIPYEASKRNSGVTKYTFRKMLRFAIDGITSFSSRPLRISLYMGFTTAFLALLYTLYAIYAWYIGDTVQGWTSLLIIVLFIGGIQLISIGIIGEYLARVYNESKGRPLYLLKNSMGNIRRYHTEIESEESTKDDFNV